MSFFSGGRPHDKDTLSKRSQFYVEFLGWMECRGLRGHKYTDPVLRELRRQQQLKGGPPKLTIEVSRKDVRITQEVEDKSKRGIQKVKFPTIPARDVTYARQATRPGDGRPDDTVACIYLGYMPRTQRYVHVHVYRFDEARTATLFWKHMSALADNNLERIREVEADLADREEIDDPREMPPDGRNDYSEFRYSSSAGSDDDSPTFGSDEIESDLQGLKDVQFFDNVTDEFKFRLSMADAPLLLPPKDYDTIRRGHGNLDHINKRRCLNLSIVGEMAVLGEKNEPNESEVGLTAPGSHVSDTNEEKQFPQPTLIREPPKADPWHSLKSASFTDSKTIALEKPVSLNIPKQVPHFPGKSDRHELGGPKTEHYSGHRSPTTSRSELVYPPKMTSPPTSPARYQHPRRPVLSKQVSDSSMLAHLKESETIGPVRHYVSGSNDDIYAIPFRGSAPPARPDTEDLRPDYLDDFQEKVVLRGMNQVYRQAHFARTRSDVLAGDDKVVVLNSRPVSADLNTRQLQTRQLQTRQLQTRQLGSELYLSGSRYREGENVASSFERINYSRRK